eukprot:1434852-Amphidinium_carterae.1
MGSLSARGRAKWTPCRLLPGAVTLLVVLDQHAVFFSPFGNEKSRLLELIDGTQRGLRAESGRREEILQAFEALERCNPTGMPLASPLLEGEWELLWTTSESILGANRPFFLRPRQDSPILQYLNPSKGFARNLEDTPISRNSVEAEIVPL